MAEAWRPRGRLAPSYVLIGMWQRAQKTYTNAFLTVGCIYALVTLIMDVAVP